MGLLHAQVLWINKREYFYKSFIIGQRMCDTWRLWMHLINLCITDFHFSCCLVQYTYIISKKKEETLPDRISRKSCKHLSAIKKLSLILSTVSQKYQDVKKSTTATEARENYIKSTYIWNNNTYLQFLCIVLARGP